MGFRVLNFLLLGCSGVVFSFFFLTVILLAGIAGPIEKGIAARGEDYSGVAKGSFPIPSVFTYSYSNSFGEPRRYGGKRKHLGIDIFAKQGTPIISVTPGTVERMGWNELGGWRLGIRGKDGNYYYYAHLKEYAQNISVNQEIHQGQIIGYVGDTGYGPVGTKGKFANHLHFGIYNENGVVINPYSLLKMWEN